MSDVRDVPCYVDCQARRGYFIENLLSCGAFYSHADDQGHRSAGLRCWTVGRFGGLPVGRRAPLHRQAKRPHSIPVRAGGRSSRQGPHRQSSEPANGPSRNRSFCHSILGVRSACAVRFPRRAACYPYMTRRVSTQWSMVPRRPVHADPIFSPNAQRQFRGHHGRVAPLIDPAEVWSTHAAGFRPSSLAWARPVRILHRSIARWRARATTAFFFIAAGALPAFSKTHFQRANGL